MTPEHAKAFANQITAIATAQSIITFWENKKEYSPEVGELVTGAKQLIATSEANIIKILTLPAAIQ
ncbi:MAG: hypothetical protein HQK96_06925 [Nitrospirae bacterium]|nr:hypothetical protein [Nitrospirota bacterium]